MVLITLKKQIPQPRLTMGMSYDKRPSQVEAIIRDIKGGPIDYQGALIRIHQNISWMKILVHRGWA